MENLQTVFSLITTALGLFVTTLTFLIKFIKNAKARRLAEQMISIANAVVPYIEQAELFTHYTGAEKKEFVITKANQFAIENGIEFDAEKVSEKIEELIKLTKSVNKNACGAINDQNKIAPAILNNEIYNRIN